MENIALGWSSKSIVAALAESTSSGCKEGVAFDIGIGSDVVGRGESVANGGFPRSSVTLPDLTGRSVSSGAVSVIVCRRASGGGDMVARGG